MFHLQNQTTIHTPREVLGGVEYEGGEVELGDGSNNTYGIYSKQYVFFFSPCTFSFNNPVFSSLSRSG